MASTQSSDQRQLQTKTVARFRGLSQYRSIAAVGLDEATDLINVIVSGSGYLEKLRAPIPRSTDPVQLIDKIYDFTQANGTRQLFAALVNGLGYFNEGMPGANFQFVGIENNPIDAPKFSLLDSNNVLYGANGQSNFAWGGTKKQNWGIAPPTTAPTLGVQVPIGSVSVASGVVTITLDISGFPNQIVNGFHPQQLKTIQAPNLVKISGTGRVGVDGLYAVNVSTGPFTFRYNSASAADTGPLTIGTCTVYTTPCGGGAFTDFSITDVSATNNVVTFFFTNNFRILAGEEFVLSGFGPAFAQFNGTWIALAADAGSVSIQFYGPDIVLTAPSPAGAIAGGFTDVIGLRTWWYSYGSSGNNGYPANESAVSPQSVPVPFSGYPSVLGATTNVRAYVNVTAPTDPQVDTIYWYASLDGGGDPYLTSLFESGTPVASGLMLGDGANDALLDVENHGSFINYPPPPAQFLSKWQGRIYFVPVNNPQALGYTGYEQILRGRPEMNVPPGNFILLNIGAATIVGHGALINGLVIWDSISRMWMLKGTVEDITTSQPVSYSEFLEELPWQLGVFSHDSIQSTPYGVVWFATDKSFHKWNGIFYGEIIGPIDIGQNLYPLLRRITPGTEKYIQSAYFNFLERDWYVALIAVDGSRSNNRILFFDMTREESDNLGVWVSDIRADSICARADANGQKHLLIASNGLIFEIKADGGSVGGIHRNQTSTKLQLHAYWKSGYEGSQDPMTVKMFRYGRLVVDADDPEVAGFKVVTSLVDDEATTLVRPQIDERELTGGKFSVNWKARRCAVNIQFPLADIDCSVIQLMLSSIPLSER